MTYWHSAALAAALVGGLAAGCELDTRGIPASCTGNACLDVDGGAPDDADSCGDGVCAAGEDCASCEADCGACGGECESRGVVYAAQIQPLFDARCASCHGADGASGLDLRSIGGVLAGGFNGAIVAPCDCESSVLFRKLGDAPPFGDRMPLGMPRLSSEEIALVCRWIDEGASGQFDAATCALAECPQCGDGVCDANESCESCSADCGACPDPGDGDVTPPTFRGAEAAEEVGGARCEVSWAPASDDLSAPADIVYELYVAAGGDDFDFSSPVAVTRPGATSHVLLAPGDQRFDVVVRAVDEARNRDSNERERTCDLR